MHQPAEHFAIFAYNVVMRHRSIPANLREDIAQETVSRLLAYVRNGRVDEERISASFVRTIAFNLFISDYRKTKRLRSLFTNEDYDAPGTSLAGDLADLLEQAPLTLSARQQDILLLRLDGLTHKEIATHLGMPAGTVGRLWAEAMHSLQIALHD